MMDYILSCGSTADLTQKQMENRDIRYVCFRFVLDGQDFADDMGQSISPEELYQKMIAGADVKTTQVPVAEYLRYFEGLLQEEKDILHVEFSSGLSGSYHSACLAAKELAQKYPERKINIVDSLGASSGYGLIMETLADLRDEGKSMDQLYQWVEENKLRMHHWFFSTDLSFYIKGGRISKTAGMVGTILNICPLLNMDNLGKLRPREKLRGKKKVIQRLVEMMRIHAEDGLDYSKKCYICHSMCPEDAQTVAELVEKEFPKLQERVQIYPIGATIGSHTGPGTLALFFWGDQRED
ncbi:MAG: DegV family protein [Oscillospiraceae bacterium]